MNGKIILLKEQFSEKEKTIFESGAFKVSTFIYSSGVRAVRIKNDKGYFVCLPYMGQIIWDMEFLGKNLVMRSLYDEPQICEENYSESYGVFLMHCGLTAMGNPTEQDKHKPHGELPIAKYKEAYILFGEDEKGKYISMSGLYSHKRCFELDYDFIPECRLYENSSEIEITVKFTNHKDLPLEYFYLCHINYRPIDGAKLLYTAKHENIVAHREAPENHPDANKTNKYIDMLEKDMSLMDEIGAEGQSYAPEIVFTCKYYGDSNGDAYTMQVLPDGYACYVSHKPAELPFGIRWIARNKNEDALGMVLPATAEHKGYSYCKKMGYERYLESGKSVVYHIKTGILTPEESQNMQKKILK